MTFFFRCASNQQSKNCDSKICCCLLFAEKWYWVCWWVRKSKCVCCDITSGYRLFVCFCCCSVRFLLIDGGCVLLVGWRSETVLLIDWLVDSWSYFVISCWFVFGRRERHNRPGEKARCGRWRKKIRLENWRSSRANFASGIRKTIYGVQNINKNTMR